MPDRHAGTAAVPQKLDHNRQKRLEEVRVLLSQRIQEAHSIAHSLVGLAERLKTDPWRWTIGTSAVDPPPGSVTMPLETHMALALDKERLRRLLDEIRWLQREEARLLTEP